MNDEQLLKQIKKDCLRLLTRREHSRKEIEQKLLTKGYQWEQITTVLDELTKQSWQSDTRYAESYARMRRHKGFGPVRIGYELSQQGISPDVVEQAMAATMDDWAGLLMQVYSKKFFVADVMDSNEQAKRSRFLLQRGFSGAMIASLFKQLTQSH